VGEEYECPQDSRISPSFSKLPATAMQCSGGFQEKQQLAKMLTPKSMK
jgi:hypothetical protein